MIHKFLQTSGSIIPSPNLTQFPPFPWLLWLAFSHICASFKTFSTLFPQAIATDRTCFFLLCGRAYALFIWNSLSIQVRLCYHIKFSLYIKLKSVISSVCVVHIFISNILALIKILCLNCCLLLNKEISANNNCQSSPAFITTSYSKLTMSPF